jgi:hypothetical protein
MSTPKKTTQITLDMNIGDAQFLRIAKMAHANNMTFNEQINQIVQSAVAGLDRPAVAVPASLNIRKASEIEPYEPKPFGFAAKPQG